MRKVITFALTAVLLLALAAPACADFDLSGLSLEELVALKDQLNLAIWQSEDWQEVEVPYGVWRVGEDIPAGHWTLTAGDGCSLFLRIGTVLDSTGADLEYWDNSWLLRSHTRSSYDPAKDTESINLILSDGLYLTISEGSVIFTPYAGKPSLGFK